MSALEVRDYRYERKFQVHELEAAQIRMLIKRHPCMFYEPYPPRYINNLYLDNEDFENYYDNVDGTDQRRKIRIRWYGRMLGEIKQPQLEFKIKSGLVGTKYIYPLPPFTLNDRFTHAIMQDVFQSSSLPPEVAWDLKGFNVVLCNRYFRWYYESRDKNFRTTVDTGMEFYQIRPRCNRFNQKYSEHRKTIVELKYDKPLDVKADRVSGFFPFSLSKNSKYAAGIEYVYP